MKTEFPIVSNNINVQAFYVHVRRNGESHSIAEMLAFQKAPAMQNSDQMFLRGKHQDHGLDKNDRFAESYIRRAHAGGVNPHGKVYMSNLADKRGPGDPEAWVSGVDDVKRVCVERGHGCEALGIPLQERAPDTGPALADDIVQEAMAGYTQDPGSPKDPRELREKIIEKHGTKKKAD